uniref:NADH dehydrogenase [ubiquinone] 1 alpha subcomplex subunit 7 n=1 Tax=Rhabditophanes sp. KR3021 TaxID=114890 RepID=A0AC35TWX1_9BILA
MSKVAKIASEAVKNRTQTPFGSWVRDKLLAVNRQKITAPPGLAKEGGECGFDYPHRFPNTQATRSPQDPKLPDGVYHKIHDNYYLGHDARRSVAPPQQLYKVTSQGQVIGTDLTPVSKGPNVNFGLPTPTPGNGVEWKRSILNEEISQQEDKVLGTLEKYDKYLAEAK